MRQAVRPGRLGGGPGADHLGRAARRRAAVHARRPPSRYRGPAARRWSATPGSTSSTPGPRPPPASGPGPVTDYLGSLTEVDPGRRPRRAPSARHRPGPRPRPPRRGAGEPERPGTGPPPPDLDAAAAAVGAGVRRWSTGGGAGAVAAAGGPDADQVVAYDLAHAAAVCAPPGRPRLRRQGRPTRPHIACAFVADALCRPRRPDCWAAKTRSGLPGTGSTPPDPFRRHVPRRRLPGLAAPASRATATSTPTSRSCATPSTVSPRSRSGRVAEHIHRSNADIPEEIITGLAEHGRPWAVHPRGIRRVRHRRRQRLPRHGRRHRGAVVGIARSRRLAHHPPRDPEPGAGGGRDRRAEAGVAAQAGLGRGHERRRRDRARLRLRRGRRSSPPRRAPTVAGS